MKLIIIKEKQSEALDSASTATEDSTAVVSLYNSWTASEECASRSPSPVEEGVNIVEPSPTLQSRRPTILEQLKKRCREEDLPAELKIRPRQRPNCVFLNYLGRSRERTSPFRPSNANRTANNTSCSLLSTADDPLFICSSQLPSIESCLDDYEDYLDADLSLFDEL